MIPVEMIERAEDEARRRGYVLELVAGLARILPYLHFTHDKNGNLCMVYVKNIAAKKHKGKNKWEQRVKESKWELYYENKQ